MTNTISPHEIAEAAERLRAGELVAFPTETVYGLGANALDAAAVEKIYIAKGRPSTSPLIVHVANASMAKSLVTDWPPLAEQLASLFWPGPLTLVLPKRPSIPDIVTSGLPTVGIRVPAHPVALALLEGARIPIAAPSANRFTELSPTTADHVRASFGDAFPILDGGPCKVGIESTVIAIEGDMILLLRPGMISAEDLRPFASAIRIAGDPAASTSHASPGQHHKHYSPRTPLHIGKPAAFGRGAFLYYSEPGSYDRSIRMPSEPAAYAAMLYDVLHALDKDALDWIAVESLPDSPAWDAIRDRLTRAAASP